MVDEKGEERQPQAQDVTYEMKSAHEAANFLRVSESTVWRYAAQDILPAYRVGKKRVMFRRSDLEGLLKKEQRGGKEPMATKDSLRLFPMYEGARPSADAFERAKAVREGILARRGGVPVSESWKDINEARDERTTDL